MKPAAIEFRFLQVITSQIADERITIAFFHWDGAVLRIAASAARVPESVPSRADLGLMLRALRAAALDRFKDSTRATTLDELCPASASETGLLSWSGIRRAQTLDADRHFERIAAGLGLIPARAEVVASIPDLNAEFRGFAHQLATSVGRDDLLQTNRHLHGISDYESPLSWKNGVWHHTFPTEFRARGRGLGKKLETLLGRIDATVPLGEVGVVVVGVPPVAAVEETLQRAEEHIERNLAGRVETIRAPVRDHTTDFSVLVRRVETDLGLQLHGPAAPHLLGGRD